jgi:hypothetical protein
MGIGTRMHQSRSIAVFRMLAISAIWTSTAGYVAATTATTTEIPPSPSSNQTPQTENLPSPDQPTAAITSKTFSTTGMTLPSLWWVTQQFAQKEPFGGKLLQEWRAYPGQDNQPGEIDFIVNRQLWSLLDYLERYSFIDEFGATAQEFGYNIRVIDSADRTKPPIASYTCKFSPEALQSLATLPAAQASVVVPPLMPRSGACTITLDAKGRAGLGGRPTASEGAPRNLGTVPR